MCNRKQEDYLYFPVYPTLRVLDRAVFPGKYRPGNTAPVFPGQHCKQCKNNKYWFSWQNLKVYFFQLGMTFHGMGLIWTTYKKLTSSLANAHMWHYL